MAYIKQTWKNLPDYSTPITAERLNHLETQYDEAVAEFRGILVAPEQYGAVGNGVSDDTEAIQGAADAIHAAGGGTLCLTPGKTYLLSGFVRIRSNTTIEGNGATLIKPPSLLRTSVAFFAIQSEGSTFYGGGGRNFVFRNIRIEGRAADDETAALLSAHHADGILIENIHAYMAVARGHVVDLNACRGVTVRNSVFEGAAWRYGDIAGEAIQADISTSGSMSVQESNPSHYSGLPSHDIYVQNCRFLRTNHSSVEYPAPIPFGCHTSSPLGLLYRNLQFTGNYVEPTQERTTGVRGVVRFLSSTGVVVSDNYFDCKGANNRVVSIIAGYGDGGAVKSGDVKISNNTITGVGISDEQAIYVSNVNNAFISGNTVLSDETIATNQNNILVTQSNSAICTGNYVRRLTETPGSTAFGIRFNSSVTRGIIANNVVEYPNDFSAGIWSTTGVTKVNNIEAALPRS